MGLDEESFSDDLGDDSFSETTNYYIYALAATVVFGLPLLFVALFKIYTDHQRNEQERLAHKEKMQEYQDAKKGLSASLRCEVNSTRAHYERETVEKEYKERQLRLEYSKRVTELESKIRSLERQLTAKNVQLEETIADDQETLRTANAEHSRQMREADGTIAQWKATCESLREELSRSARQAREEYKRLDEKYQREREERIKDQRHFDANIRSYKCHNLSLQGQIRELKNKLARTEESLREAQQRNWRRFLPGSVSGSSRDNENDTGNFSPTVVHFEDPNHL